MKFDLSMVTVLLAALAPAVVLFLASVWDRCQRKRTEKPPQTQKLQTKLAEIWGAPAGK
jgi:hypothetical protein